MSGIINVITQMIKVKIKSKAFLKNEVKDGWFKSKTEYIPVIILAVGAEVTEHPNVYNSLTKMIYQKILIETENEEKKEVRSTDLFYTNEI